MGPIVIRGASLLTLDEQGTVIDDGELRIDGGVIAYAGPVGEDPEPDDTATVIDVPGDVVMPGFANCHTHSYSALLKGSVDKMPLDLFMVGAILGAGSRTASDVYLAAKISALEMLQSGTTACLDHFSHRPRHSPDALDAVCRAYADSGIRAAVAPMFSDLPFRDTIPVTPADMSKDEVEALPGTAQDPAPFFEMMENAVDAWGSHALVDIMLGVDSPQRCSDALLDRGGAFCAAHGIGNHTHLLEAKTQWAMAERRDPRGFVAYLADKGLAGEKSSFAHFIWFTDSDLEMCAQTGVSVVHNPASNLALGSGIQPLMRLAEAGVPVAFGSDGLNVGHMSMFEKTRLAALLPRVAEADPDRWITAGAALRMACVNGATALGRGGRAGTLEAGQLADLVVLDGKSVALQPRGDLPTQVLLQETGASVRRVFVGGEEVLQNGVPTRFDPEQTLQDASEAALRLTRDNSDFAERLEVHRPGLIAMVRRIVAAEEGPCRIAKLA
ncbi:MAG: amidohydrolase family protein [Pseudomonadota bacterium]